MSFTKKDVSVDPSDYENEENNSNINGEEITTYPQYEKRFSYLLRGSRAQTDDHMLRFARAPSFLH